MVVIILYNLATLLISDLVHLILMYRSISRQCLKYAHATIEKILEEVSSAWSALCPLLGNGLIDTHRAGRQLTPDYHWAD